MLELGCLFGALGAGVLADRVSRRSSIAAACGACCPCEDLTGASADWLFEAVFCIGSALQTWAHSLTQITAGRAIGGLGVGALRYSLTYLLNVPSKTFDRPSGILLTQHALPLVYGGDQSARTARVVISTGTIFYCSWLRSWILDGVFDAEW